MDTYNCNVEYRDYQNWSYQPNVSIDNPLNYKLFNGDTFYVDNDSVTLFDSPTRNCVNIPGILLLENNRTYGRTKNKRKLFYKCRPHDRKIPHFLIPYDMPMGFNKNFKNKYITFYFDRWDKSDKHPYGLISQNLGDLYHFPSYCEYILYCKNLHSSITESIAKTKSILRENNFEKMYKTIYDSKHKYGEFLDRTNDYIFSIDPEGCLDRDDAISIKKVDDKYLISVYIANVWVWLDCLNLWDQIGNRVSTIYFPEFKRPMIPTAIGEKLCSLDENKSRFGFVMDFFIDISENGTLLLSENEEYPKLNQCILSVSKNYSYEEKMLVKNKQYKDLEYVTRKLGKSINDSHDVVAFWMMLMNNKCAKMMRERKIGIFRTVQSKCKQDVIYETSDSIPTFVKMIEQQISGNYIAYSDEGNYEHEVLSFREYVHFTSPIRRMVDLLNQMEWVIQILQPMQLNKDVVKFHKNQLKNLEILNNDMKKIRRIQSDCDILHKVRNIPEYTEHEYDGIVISSNDNKCNIYIEALGWITQYKTFDTEYTKYQKVKCKLFSFENEEQMKRKIRIQIL